MTSDEFFAARRIQTTEFVERWCSSFARHLGEDGLAALDGGKCAYAIGSAGRGEIGTNSDLDLFVVTKGKRTKIEETLIQAAVIRAMDELGLPKPSNDAMFLEIYESDELKRQLGLPKDDQGNTFTVRMLLLLESRPLMQAEAYKELVETVIEAYWSNSEDHRTDYLPMVLVNDVVRYWRVLLLNYEAKHAKKVGDAKKCGDAEVLATAQGKRRLASQKLRFSRAMTCYSMIARLLHATRRQVGSESHIEQSDVLRMVSETPIERLQHVRDASDDPVVVAHINNLLGLYRDHIVLRDMPEAELVDLFKSEARRPHVLASRMFGESLFELVQHLGQTSPLYRYVVV